MTPRLGGWRILIPRGGDWGASVEQLCSDRGAVGVVVPIIDTKPPRDTHALESFLAALREGRYTWLFVTSAASVEVLRAHDVVIPPSTSIATVGPTTARSLELAGYRVAFVPTGASSARALVDQWKRATPRSPAANVLVMRSDLAAATISDSLEAAGHLVAVCIAYRTVGVDIAQGALDDLAAGRFDAVLVTSHSVAIELGAQLKDTPAPTVFAFLGHGTAREATKLGLVPGVTAAEQTIESLLDAVAEYFEGNGMEQP